MAKEAGIGWTTFSLDDSGGTLRAIVNDVTQVNFDAPRAVQDITGLDKSAMERLHLLADFTVSFTGVFNDLASTGFHTVVKSLATIRTLTMVVSGQTLSNEVFLTSVNWSRPASGEFTGAVSASLGDGTVPVWA
jgi:hypothetical protein